MTIQSNHPQNIGQGPLVSSDKQNEATSATEEISQFPDLMAEESGLAAAKKERSANNEKESGEMVPPFALIAADEKRAVANKKEQKSYRIVKKSAAASGVDAE